MKIGVRLTSIHGSTSAAWLNVLSSLESGMVEAAVGWKKSQRAGSERVQGKSKLPPNLHRPCWKKEQTLSLPLLPPPR